MIKREEAYNKFGVDVDRWNSDVEKSIIYTIDKIYDSIGSCGECYYAVNDATLCEMHTRVSEDADVCEFDITPDWFCADFKRKA